MDKRLGLVAIGVMAGVLVTAGSAAATTQEVNTPAGTFYVVENHAVDDPSVHIHRVQLICIDQICFSTLEPHAHTGVHVELGVFEETNECDALQTAPSDCDGDDTTEDADREVVHVQEGATFCTVFPFC